jgi:hypothetical protein
MYVGTHTRECHIYTNTCQTYSRVCIKHTLRVKSHSACGNLTLRVQTNLVLVEITLVRVLIANLLPFCFSPLGPPPHGFAPGSIYVLNVPDKCTYVKNRTFLKN